MIPERSSCDETRVVFRSRLTDRHKIVRYPKMSYTCPFLQGSTASPLLQILPPQEVLGFALGVSLWHRQRNAPPPCLALESLHLSHSQTLYLQVRSDKRKTGTNQYGNPSSMFLILDSLFSLTHLSNPTKARPLFCCSGVIIGTDSTQRRRARPLLEQLVSRGSFCPTLAHGGEPIYVLYSGQCC